VSAAAPAGRLAATKGAIETFTRAIALEYGVLQPNGGWVMA
jgi:hypothetical protein